MARYPDVCDAVRLYLTSSPHEHTRSQIAAAIGYPVYMTGRAITDLIDNGVIALRTDTSAQVSYYRIKR